MQTYGYSWTVVSGPLQGTNSTSIRAYWPQLGRASKDSPLSDVTKYRITDDKRRLNRTSGSGPYWHHKSEKYLDAMSIESGSSVINVVAGKRFFECGGVSPRFGFLIVNGKDAFFCAIYPVRGSGNAGVILYQYQVSLANRTNFVLLARSVNVDVYPSISYSKVPHTLEYAESCYNKHMAGLFQRSFYKIANYRNVSDILSSPSIEVDYSRMVDKNPPALDFLEDWNDISLIGYPIGRSAQFSQRAYELAASDLPQADVNAVANTMESAQALRNVILSDISAILPKGKTYVKAMSSTWLAYRYAVSTTSFDIQSYKELICRMEGMSGHRFIKSHGMCCDTATGDIYRVTLKYRVDGLPNDIASKLAQLGFRLNLVNGWDLVPYSFIVDWFFHVSDFLNVLDQKSASSQLVPVEAWASRESGDHSTYIRWSTKWRATAPILQVKETSSKTIFMRIADAIALLAK